MQPTFQYLKDKGGRPPKIKVKIVIPLILKELRLANAAMVRKSLEQDVGLPVSLTTVKRYLVQLEEEGQVARRRISPRIITYELR